MKRIHTYFAVLAGCTVLGFTIVIMGCGGDITKPTVKINLGYLQQPIPEALVLQALKHTDVLEKSHIEIDFTAHADRDQLINSAVNRQADVIIGREQALAELFSRSDDWTIVSRFSYHQINLYLPADSPVESVSDLEDKRFAQTSSTLARRYIKKAAEKAGLDPERDLRFVDWTLDRQLRLAQKGKRSEWGRIDAVINDAPEFTSAVSDGFARSIKIGRSVSVLLVSNRLIDTSPETVEALLTAMMDAYYYYARNFEQTVEWYQQETGASYDLKVYKSVAAAEMNTRAMMKGHVSLNLPDIDIQNMQTTIDYMREMEMIDTQIDIRGFINLKYLRSAEEEWFRERDGYPTMKME